MAGSTAHSFKGRRGAHHHDFCQVGNAVLKVCSQSSNGDLVYNVARNVVNCSRDRVTMSIAPASEGDLLDALEGVKGSARLRIQELLRIVRDEPAQPLEIKIVNAKDIGSVAKVLTVKRDDTGKLSGAVSQPIGPNVDLTAHCPFGPQGL